jgi:hypothetical protein
MFKNQEGLSEIFPLIQNPKKKLLGLMATLSQITSF